MSNIIEVHDISGEFTHVVVGYRNFQMGITGSVYTSGQVSELDTSGNNSNNRILFEGTENECYSWLEQNA